MNVEVKKKEGASDRVTLKVSNWMQSFIYCVTWSLSYHLFVCMSVMCRKHKALAHYSCNMQFSPCV